MRNPEMKPRKSWHERPVNPCKSHQQKKSQLLSLDQGLSNGTHFGGDQTMQIHVDFEGLCNKLYFHTKVLYHNKTGRPVAYATSIRIRRDIVLLKDILLMAEILHHLLGKLHLYLFRSPIRSGSFQCFSDALCPSIP